MNVHIWRELNFKQILSMVNIAFIAYSICKVSSNYSKTLSCLGRQTYFLDMHYTIILLFNLLKYNLLHKKTLLN